MTLQHVERVFFGVLATTALAVVLCRASAQYGLAGPRYNLTESMPEGLYWFTPGSTQRGDWVTACLPDALAKYALEHQILAAQSYPCANGVEPILKVLAAVGGDVVEISNCGVSINGGLFPNSARRRFDSHGSRVESLAHSERYVIASNQVFLLGLTPRSWDSRYWKSVPRTLVQGRLTPLFTE